MRLVIDDRRRAIALQGALTAVEDFWHRAAGGSEVTPRYVDSVLYRKSVETAVSAAIDQLERELG